MRTYDGSATRVFHVLNIGKAKTLTLIHKKIASKYSL
jgi:hypothetical protein